VEAEVAARGAAAVVGGELLVPAVRITVRISVRMRVRAGVRYRIKFGVRIRLREG